MKVAYTGTIFFNQRYGGISRYFTELVKSLKNDVKIFAPISKNIYLKNLSFKKKKSIYIKKIPQYKSLIKANNLITNYLIKNYNPNILHETYYSENLIKLKKYNTVLTIYDLIHEKFQNDLYKNKINEKKRLLNYVDHFICISEQTKKDFIEFYKVPADKVSVVYLGCDHLNIKPQKNKTDILKDKPYLLYIGSRIKYKNFKVLFEALNKLRVKDLKLICFGGEKFSKKEFEMNNSNIEIKQIFGDDEILSNLIQNAHCYINTSLYEGFGIPNIEAMKNGCPVICTDIPVFREICKNSAIYFDKNSSEDLANKIDTLILSAETKNDYINNGISLSKIYSWENCAINTINIYKNLSN